MKRLALLCAILAGPGYADPEGYAHMMDWGSGYGPGMMFGPVLWLIVLGLVVAGLIWFVRDSNAAMPRTRGGNALGELDLRFARGEIDAEDYAARKALLTK